MRWFLILTLGAALAGCAPAPAVDIQPQVEAALTEMVLTLTAVPAATTEPTAAPPPTATLLPPGGPATATTEPTARRGDGTYLVGSQMARGHWVSDGAAEGVCYWTSRHADGIILQSYLGVPGGELTLGDYDYEVHFENCGTWEYVGP